MGIDVYVLDFLSRHRRETGPLGRTLQLGRQQVSIGRAHRRAADAILRRDGLGGSVTALTGPDGYAEPLLRALGATDIVAADASSYEGATFIHDFNDPLPEPLPEPFDTILDGGTLEHVFNLPVALSNLMRLTRMGGCIVSINGANNFLGHGFYQFSPDLVHRVFSEANGFQVLRADLVSLDGRPRLVPAPDPASAGARLEIGPTPRRTYLMVAARKLSEVVPFRAWPQQTDYALAWSACAAPPGTADGEGRGFIAQAARRVRALVERCRHVRD